MSGPRFFITVFIAGSVIGPNGFSVGITDPGLLRFSLMKRNNWLSLFGPGNDFPSTRVGAVGVIFVWSHSVAALGICDFRSSNTLLIGFLVFIIFNSGK